MRSIRRSMTVYMLVLLAATLGVAWVVIDQVTARALAAREAAVADKINATYQERCRNERERIDQALLQQAKDLGNAMHLHAEPWFRAEFAKFGIQAASAQLIFGPAPAPGLSPNLMTSVAWTAYGYAPPSPNRPAAWWFGYLFRQYFASLPLPEEYIRHVDDEDGSSDYYQINTQAGREWFSKSLAGRKLPFDHKEFDARAADPGRQVDTQGLIDWTIGYTTLGPDQVRVRRVLYKAPYPRRAFGGRPGGFGPPPPPRSLLGAWAASGGVLPPPQPATESLPRLYIQCARPQSQIDGAMAKFADERDAELEKLALEIGAARRSLRFDLTLIGVVAFLAVAIGGPLLVGRGLRPVGKLSDAVSRVSEKDFRLPHDGSNLTVELVPIHARLTQTLDLLQRAFAREKQAVADISHELRTPIAALMATIDVALRKQRTPEQYRTALEECRVISKQLGQLVERIMTLASLDAGNDHLQISRVETAELAAGCATVIRPLAAARGITVDLHTEGLIEVDTDAAKLREVLMNLLHNAVEYNRQDGVIELSVWQDGSNVIFEVRDTGIGIAPESKGRIFERFFRADPSRHSTGVHAGLGLAIVKEYVERLGGTIAVESTPGVGSVFRVTVPASNMLDDSDFEAEGVALRS
jgi:signal transduction histidine kinase